MLAHKRNMSKGQRFRWQDPKRSTFRRTQASLPLQLPEKRWSKTTFFHQRIPSLQASCPLPLILSAQHWSRCWKRQIRTMVGVFFLRGLWLRLVGRFLSTRNLATSFPDFQIWKILRQNRVRRARCYFKDVDMEISWGSKFLNWTDTEMCSRH